MRRIPGGGEVPLVDFLSEFLHERPDLLPDRATLTARLERTSDFGHASQLLALLAERDRRDRRDRRDQRAAAWRALR